MADTPNTDKAQDLLGEGSPDEEPSHPAQIEDGVNEIIVDTVHFGQKAMVFEKGVPVTVRDGTTLMANVFRPVGDGQFPVVLSADIYGKDRYNADMFPNFPTVGGVVFSDFAGWEAPDPGYWVPNGYVVVKAAFRGTSGSEGDSVSPMSAQEARDYYDIIEWVADQPWCDGHVGTNGVSYLAMDQWRVAQLDPPHLDAMIPWEGVSDLYREFFFHGGIPETGFSDMWVNLQRQRWPNRVMEDLLAAQAEHPLDDEFWAGKRGDLSDIQIPLFAGTSWPNHGLHTRGTIEGFKQAASENKWLEVHGRKEWEYYYQRETLERQKRFFDYFLKGKENDWLETPRVRIEVRDRYYSGHFRDENEWPLARRQPTPWYLDASAGLLQDSTVATESEATYLSTESAASANGQVSFTRTMEEDVELSGNMNLRLWVSTDGGDDLDLFTVIKKLDRRGNEVHLPDFNHHDGGHVASGWLRASHRELDEDRSRPLQPWHKHEQILKVDDGERVPVEIEILPSSTLFREGESLQVVVAGSAIPKSSTEALPAKHGLDFQHDESVNAGEHTIHTGGAYDSYLLAPVIPSKE